MSIHVLICLLKLSLPMLIGEEYLIWIFIPLPSNVKTMSIAIQIRSNGTKKLYINNSFMCMFYTR